MNARVPYDCPSSRTQHGRIRFTAGPPLATTGNSTRWHRVRYAYLVESTGGVHVAFWCGQFVTVNRRITISTATTVPARQSLCGTCEGKAIRYGREPLGADPQVHLAYTPCRRKEYEVARAARETAFHA